MTVLRDSDRYRTDTSASTIRDTFGSQMLSAEGDAQRRYKVACAPPFTTRAVREHAEPWIRDRVGRLLDPLVPAGRGELRAGLAGPLALGAVAMVLGLPEEYHPAIRTWYDAFEAALANFARDPAIRARGREAAAEFRRVVAPVLERPGEGLLHQLARAQPAGLDPDEILRNALIILFGGIETTEAMILNALWALLTHPGALAAVRADPARLPGAIEESLRWEPAAQTCTRHTIRDTVLRGVTIPAGDTVQCMLGGANRDPAVFDQPDRFDPDRPNAARHLAFGSGRHFCLGAALARTEAWLAVAAVLERCPGVRLDPARGQRPVGSEFRKPPTLHLVWRTDA